LAWWVRKNLSYSGSDFDWVDPDFVKEKRGLVGSGLSLSRPLSAQNVPKAARSCHPAKSPPKQHVFIVDFAVAVTAKFKNLVERFEPDLHLFAPIELQYHDGEPMEGEYYFFNCNVDIDCVLTDNKPEWFRKARTGHIHPSLSLIQKLTPLEIELSKQQIEGRHLWTGGPLGWNQLFISNEFCAALKKERIRSIEFWRECHEIDRPWIAEEHMGPLLDGWRNYVAHGRNVEMGYL
jgi:hypothetical protein